MTTKQIGKIQSITFGYGGYDDAMIGISFSLGSDKECWGVQGFKGTWAAWHEDCEWTEADQIKKWGETVKWFRDLLRAAKVQQINQLVGIPVEAIFEDNILRDWRILTEVI